jgi:DNA-binding HxlR family transcriptional regulator
MLKPEHIEVPVLPPNAHLDSDCRGVASVLARVGDKWSVFVIMLLGGARAASTRSSAWSVVSRSGC